MSLSELPITRLVAISKFIAGTLDRLKPNLDEKILCLQAYQIVPDQYQADIELLRQVVSFWMHYHSESGRFELTAMMNFYVPVENTPFLCELSSLQSLCRRIERGIDAYNKGRETPYIREEFGKELRNLAEVTRQHQDMIRLFVQSAGHT